MPLEIIHREREGIEVLDLHGRLTLGPEDLEFRNQLNRLAEAGKIRVALNLKDLHQLDTTGLGTLLSGLAKLRKAGGNLAIYDVQPSHIKLLTAAKLETVLDLFREEQDAINSFFPDRHLKRWDVLEFVQATEPQSLVTNVP